MNDGHITLKDGSHLTPQEHWVLDQAEAGKLADLGAEFGDAPEDRRLRAGFLEDLLTAGFPGFSVHYRGLRISHAVILEGLSLANAEISGTLELSACTFKGSVSFGSAVIGKDLFLDGSRFQGPADFYRLKAGGGLFCRHALFAAGANFSGAEIAGQFGVGKARFLSPDQRVNFAALKVELSVICAGVEFHGPVDFAAANVRRQFAAPGAKFLAPGHKASFQAMQVGQHAFFQDAAFHGPVDFGAAQIGGQFLAQRSQFRDQGQGVSFAGIRVGRDAFFEHAYFHGSAIFAGAVIGGQFLAEGARFLAAAPKADFRRLEVGRSAFFQGADFSGPADFSLMHVGGNFYLTAIQKYGLPLASSFREAVNFGGATIDGRFSGDGALFVSQEWVSFKGLQVGRSLSLSGALFAGPVNFTFIKVKRNFYLDPFGTGHPPKTLFMGPANFSRAEIDGQFSADQAIFRSPYVVFLGLKVGLGTFFNGTIFFGGLDLKDAALTDLEVSGLPLFELALDRTEIARKLIVRDIQISKFSGQHLAVGLSAELNRLIITDEADFRDSSIQQLQIVDTNWPAPHRGKKRVYLDGLTYQSITTKAHPDAKEKWQDLWDWLWYSRFNRQCYQQLDDYWQRVGLRKWADKVYITGKRRELAKLSHWHPGKWLTKFFWGVLAGYGRKPGRLFWPALALVLLGWYVFPAVSLPPGHWLAPFQQQHPAWTGLALSLDRLLPGVDLGLAKFFQPRDLTVHAWLIWQLQKLLGWVLLPIGLAALYTRLK